MKGILRKEKKYLIFIFLSLGFALLLNLIARYNLTFAEWYSNFIYPLFVTTISRVMSVFPFSVIEILLYMSIIILVIIIIKIRRHLKMHHRSGKEMLVIIIIRVFTFICLLVLICTFTCSINYHRRTFASYSGLTIKESSVEELINLCNELIADANKLGEEIELDEDGYGTIPSDSREESVRCMKKLGKQYPVLSGYYPKPKGIFTSSVLSYQMLAGVYSAFTIEANYNTDMPDYLIPETMCHELSHLKGFMREDEAEFISYLACLQSEETAFLYSGIMDALVYSLNALHSISEEEQYSAVYQTISSQNQKQLSNDRNFWKKYKGTVSQISDAASDIFLKANNQSDGLKSYGRMVDLLLAYNRAQKQ